MVYACFLPGIYLIYTIFHYNISSIYLVYDIFIGIYQVFTRYMPSIYQVYTWWLVLWRRTWPHAARATSNHITCCHYWDSFRFTTFAHFTFAHMNVYCPFRHKERRKTPFFARAAHKAFHLGQYFLPWIARKLPSIRPRATSIVAF